VLAVITAEVTVTQIIGEKNNNIRVFFTG